MKLTEAVIKGLKVEAKRYSRSDRGLAIEVLPTGKKTFCTWQQGRKHTLGTWPEMSLREAREKFNTLKHENATSGALKANITLRQFLRGPFNDKWLAQRKRGEDSLKRMSHVLLVKFPIIADRPLTQITEEHVLELKVAMMKCNKPATIRRDLGDLKVLLNKAVSWNFIRRSPAANVSSPSVDRGAVKLALEPEEIERLKAALKEWKAKGDYFDSGFGAEENRNVASGFYGNRWPRWFYVFVRLLMNTGSRKGEALALTWGDIGFSTGWITLKGTTTKNSKTRKVPISTRLKIDLLEWHQISHDEDIGALASDPDAALMFVPPEPDAKVFPVKTVTKPWERLRSMAKLDKTFTCHITRHTFATTLVNRGVPLPRVQKLLGHADLATTARYLGVSDDALIEAVELI